MISFFELVTILFFSLIFALLFTYAFRKKGPWGSFWSFIIVLFLASLMAVTWMTPYGPVYYGVAVFDVLGIVLLIAIILAITTPSNLTEKNKHQFKRSRSRITVFWTLVVALLVFMIAGLIV